MPNGAVTVDLQRAEAVRQFVEATLPDRITIRRVARGVGLSESTIQRALRRARGPAFHELVDRCRFDRIQLALGSTPYIKDEALALEAGWRSRTSLYALVRRVSGRSLHSMRRSGSSEK